VIEPGRALGRAGPVGARHLEREVVVMAAGGEEDDAAVLAASGLGEPEQIAVEAGGRLEITDEERDVSELSDLHGARSVA
jgi:hypothetical protein